MGHPNNSPTTNTATPTKRITLPGFTIKTSSADPSIIIGGQVEDDEEIDNDNKATSNGLCFPPKMAAINF